MKDIVKLGYESKLLDGTGEVPFDHVVKFAELIIKECITQLSYCGDDGGAKELQEHFGVE